MPINLTEVKEYIENNLAELHTLDDLASGLGLSSETLKKEFLRGERIGLSEYLVNVRVEKMKEKLIHSNDKCLTICLQVGLREDAGARLFKKLTGMTMQEFREKHGDRLRRGKRSEEGAS